VTTKGNITQRQYSVSNRPCVG